jgi:hypothetical protein
LKATDSRIPRIADDCLFSCTKKRRVVSFV